MRILRVLGVMLFLSCNAFAAPNSGFSDPLNTPSSTEPQPARAAMIAVSDAGGRLFAAGLRGVLIYSDDGGKAWHQAASPTSSDLTAVSFPTASEGWAVGHDGVILHSGDGGRTWVKQIDGTGGAEITIEYFKKRVEAGDQSAQPFLEDAKAHEVDNASNPFLSVIFLSEREGYASGSFGLLMHTVDGGAHWSPFNDKIDNPEALHLFGMCATPSGKIFIASEKGAVFSKDTLQDRFSVVQTGYKGSLFGVVCASDEVALAYGLRGTLFKTTDGGKSWSQVNSGTTASLTGAVALKDGRVALLDVSGNVMVSDREITHFERVSSSSIGMAADLVEAVNGGTHRLVLVGQGGVHVTNFK